MFSVKDCLTVNVLKWLKRLKPTIPTASGLVTTILIVRVIIIQLISRRNGSLKSIARSLWRGGDLDGVIRWNSFTEVNHWGDVSLWATHMDVLVYAERLCLLWVQATVDWATGHRLIETVLQAGQYVSIQVEHLIVHDLSFPDVVFLKVFLVFSSLHDDACLSVVLYIHLKCLFLEVFYHSYVSFLEIPDAEFEDFDLLFDFPKKHGLSEERVEDAVLTTWKKSLKESHDASSCITLSYGFQLLIQLSDYQVL